jgi:hypothetical protein
LLGATGGYRRSPNWTFQEILGPGPATHGHQIADEQPHPMQGRLKQVLQTQAFDAPGFLALACPASRP